jgi:hypothetical protein
MNIRNHSTRDVVEFLRAWFSSDKEGDGNLSSIEGTIALLNEVPSFDHMTSTKPIIETIQKLRVLKNAPALDTYVTRIIRKVESLDLTDPAASCNAISDIIQMLERSRDSIPFLNQLSREPLLSGNGFKGSLHCELFLASLIILARSKPFGEWYDR